MALFLPDHRLPGDLGLHRRGEQGGGDPDQQHGADHGPRRLRVPKAGEAGDPQHAADQDEGAYAVTVDDPAADHEQPLLAEGAQAEDEADHPARHADRGAEVRGEERQNGVEAHV
ncbi:hypothetical protein GCM10009730_61700 [Streptomyces albidochromogenes]